MQISLIDRILLILNRILLPLAKTISIERFEEGVLACNIEDPFKFSYSGETVLRAERGTIYTRFADLFQAMIASSTDRVEFAPRQELVIVGQQQLDTVTERSIERLRGLDTPSDYEPKADVGRLIERLMGLGTPSGFEASYDTQNGLHIILNKEANFAGYGKQKSITIQAIQGATLSIEERRKYIFSMEDFQERMQVKGELILPPGQTLRIVGVDILELHKEYESIPYLKEIAGDFSRFFLNQILLPLGKTLVADTECEAHWHCGADFFTVSSEKSLIFRTGFGQLVTTLDRLKRGFINSHLSSIQLRPQQHLIIYGLEEAQRTQLDEWVMSQDGPVIMKGLAQFFWPYNPTGFIWNIKFEGGLHKGALEVRGQGNVALLLRAERLLEIGLQRANGSWFVINLLNNSSPELMEGIAQSDEKAYIYLLFRAMFYFCCEDFRHFRTDELPLFFKESTRDQLQELLQDDGFTDSMRLVLKDPEIYLRLSHILRMTPAEFGDLDHKLLPIPLKNLLAKIMKLAYEELQGSNFLTECLRQVHTALEDGKLRPFLRP